MGKGFAAIGIVFAFVIISSHAYAEPGSQIPSWIKNNAGWWADGQVDDSAFAIGIDFLMKEGLLSTGKMPDEFPSYLKTAAGDWTEGRISDDQYLLTLEKWIASDKQDVTQPNAIKQNVKTGPKLPEWVRNIFVWYAEGNVSETELLNSVKYLVQERIIVVGGPVQDSTCNDLYDEAINRIVSNTVFDKIAAGVLEAGLLYPELLADKRLAEAIWSESGRTLVSNQERVQEITAEMDSRGCNLTYEQGSMIGFLQGWLR